MTSNAQTRDQEVYTVLRGSSHYRLNVPENDEGDSDSQQFVYQPIVRDRAISYILKLKFNRRLTATVRFGSTLFTFFL